MKLKQIKNLIQMLQSETEDRDLALQTLEQNSSLKNLVPLLLCYKFGRPKKPIWATEAPSALALIEEHVELMGPTGITFKALFDTIIRIKAPVDQFDTFAEFYASHLKDECHKAGYKFVKDVTITLTHTE